MATETLRKVDQTGIKVGQGTTIVLLLLGFVLNSWLLVGIVAVSQLLSAFDAPFAPYRLLYQRVIKPLGITKPNVIRDNLEPHRFAQLLGGLMNTVAVALLLVGVPTPAWVLVWVVIALANLNFWLNFCLGCWMYYQLHRLGVPGFTQSPVEG